MAETEYSTDYRQAQEDMDTAWARADAISGPLKEKLTQIVAELEGVTSMPPGPGANKLIDTFITYAAQEAGQLAELATALYDARTAEDRRDNARDALPTADEVMPPAYLESTDPIVVREWLRTAGYAEVHDALTNVLDAEKQKEWAVRLEEWARVDGNQSAVFEAIAAAVPTAAASGIVASPSNYVEGAPKEFASADDVPVGKGGMPAPDAGRPMTDDELAAAKKASGGAADTAGTDAAAGKPGK